MNPISTCIRLLQLGWTLRVSRVYERKNDDERRQSTAEMAIDARGDVESSGKTRIAQVPLKETRPQDALLDRAYLSET